MVRDSPPSPQNSKPRVSVERLSCRNRCIPDPAVSPLRAPSPARERNQSDGPNPGQRCDGTSRDRGLPACRPPRPAGSRACRAPPRRVMPAYRDAAIRREQGHGSCSTANPLFTLIGGRGWDQHEPPTTHPRTPPVPVGAAGHSPWGTHCRLLSTRRAGGDAGGRQFLPQRCWH